MQGSQSGAQGNGQSAVLQDIPNKAKERQDNGSQALRTPQPADSADDASTAPYDPMEQPDADAVVALRQQLSIQSAQVEGLKQVIVRLQAEVDQAGDRAEVPTTEAASLYSAQVAELQAQLGPSHSRGQQLEGQLEAAAAEAAAAQKRADEMQTALELSTEQAKVAAADGQAARLSQDVAGNQQAACAAQAEVSKFREQLRKQQQELMATRQKLTVFDEQAAQTQSELQAARCAWLPQWLLT